jgi:DNA-binding IclR family transcriptional regulator
MDKVSIPREDRSRPRASRASGGAKALVKGVAIVDAIAAAPRPLELVDLLDASGLPRPTALRLIDVLLEQGMLQRAGRAYALGPRLAVWGQRYLAALDVRAQAVDLMRALADETRETCYLGVRDGRRVLYVAKADSPQAVRPAAEIGNRNPLHSTGIGKALLAFGAPDEAVAYAHGGPLEIKTPNTIVDAERLLVEMEHTRERGYAVDDVENEDGVRCVAAPVYDHAGQVVAAMSVSAPAYRFALKDLPRIAPGVRAAALELSTRIGYREGGST